MQKLFPYILNIFLLLMTALAYGQQQRDTAIIKKTLSAADLQQRQQRYEKKADSSLAGREVKRMKEVIRITSEQERLLLQAAITTNVKRREVFKSYWKKEGFRAQMIRVDKSADSLYQSIVGDSNYQMYKDTLQSRLLQRRQLMEQQGKFGSVDTLGNKPITKPLD